MYMDNITQSNGDKAELTAIYYYSQSGYLVSKPLQHSPHYDLLIDDGKKVYRVEVKYTSVKVNNSYKACLKTTSSFKGKLKTIKRINKMNTDLVFILDVDNNIYEFNSKDLHDRSTINVNKSCKQFIKTF